MQMNGDGILCFMPHDPFVKKFFTCSMMKEVYATFAIAIIVMISKA